MVGGGEMAEMHLSLDSHEDPVSAGTSDRV